MPYIRDFFKPQMNADERRFGMIKLGLAIGLVCIRAFKKNPKFFLSSAFIPLICADRNHLMIGKLGATSFVVFFIGNLQGA